jgi:hypothetical protein
MCRVLYTPPSELHMSLQELYTSSQELYNPHESYGFQADCYMPWCVSHPLSGILYILHVYATFFCLNILHLAQTTDVSKKLSTPWHNLHTF